MLKTISNFDVIGFLWFNRLQTSGPVRGVFKAISHTGDGHLYIALAIAALLSQNDQNLLWAQAVLLAFVFELPCFMLLKAFFKRERPFNKLPSCIRAVQPSDEFSMPSGHTAAAFLVASLLVQFYGDVALIAYFWAGLIGLSRVVLGVHYPTDIAVGAILGLSAASIATAILL
ncbi:phosphatidylglycerophosphatase B [Gammaproteobacteria bacterium MOLA455]|nr:phosphatidylglycerophosphatase B [Gammaproteobacteria bacterium MOLA455]